MPIGERSTDLAVIVKVIACQGFAAVCVHLACAEAGLCRVFSVFDENDKVGCKRKKALVAHFFIPYVFLAKGNELDK